MNIKNFEKIKKYLIYYKLHKYIQKLHFNYKKQRKTCFL